MKTHLDWSAYDTYGIGDAFSGIPMTGGSYAKAVAVCMHNRECQREGKGVMCPSFRITHDPAHSTEARVAAFKAALNGDLGEQPFLHPDLAESLDLCVLCKGCKKECPSAVDMTLIKTEFTAQRNDIVGVSRRQRLLGGPAGMGGQVGASRPPTGQLAQRVPAGPLGGGKVAGSVGASPYSAADRTVLRAARGPGRGRRQARGAVRRYLRLSLRSRDRRSGAGRADRRRLSGGNRPSGPR